MISPDRQSNVTSRAGVYAVGEGVEFAVAVSEVMMPVPDHGAVPDFEIPDEIEIYGDLAPVYTAYYYDNYANYEWWMGIVQLGSFEGLAGTHIACALAEIEEGSSSVVECEAYAS